jgi:hypothetical protein
MNVRERVGYPASTRSKYGIARSLRDSDQENAPGGSHTPTASTFDPSRAARTTPDRIASETVA